jgi:2-phosphoglycerate kinase
VVLYVEEGDRHQRFIVRRERHNNRGLAHYLDNLDRIREIQREMVSNGREAGWLVMDASAQDDPVGMVEASFK